MRLKKHNRLITRRGAVGMGHQGESRGIQVERPNLATTTQLSSGPDAYRHIQLKRSGS
jgi:hypothetical protein